MSAKRVSPISINTYLRGFKAYTRWLHADGHLKEGLRVQFLKTEQNILITFTLEQVSAFVNHRPSCGINEPRIWLLGCLLFDTGLRVI